jgi:outer membrane protein
MKTAQVKWALAAALVLALGSSFAQESKVGYINTQRITTESAPAKAAQARARILKATERFDGPATVAQDYE